MSHDEFVTARETADAERILTEQHSEIIGQLREANFHASQALSKATLTYGPAMCGPVVWPKRNELEREISTAVQALYRAADVVEAIEGMRRADPERVQAGRVTS